MKKIVSAVIFAALSLSAPAQDATLRIAADKGYKERKWFHYCFWLGLIGYLMVCAMPDKKRRRKHSDEE